MQCQGMGGSALPQPPCGGGTKAWLGSVPQHSRLSLIPAKAGYCSLQGNRGNTQTSPSLSLKHICSFCSLHSRVPCVCRSRRIYKVHQDICYKESCESTSSKRTSSRYSPQQHTGCASLPVILDRRMWLPGVPQHAWGHPGWGWTGVECRHDQGLDASAVSFACEQWPRGMGLTVLSSLLFQKAKQQSHTEEAIEVSTCSSSPQKQAGAFLMQGVREIGAGQGTTLAHATMSRGCEGLWLKVPGCGWGREAGGNALLPPGSAAPPEQEIPA